MLRHIQAECHLSTSQVPLAMGLFYSFFFRSPIPTELMISEHAFSLGLQRLHARDELYYFSGSDVKPSYFFKKVRCIGRGRSFLLVPLRIRAIVAAPM